MARTTTGDVAKVIATISDIAIDQGALPAAIIAASSMTDYVVSKDTAAILNVDLQMQIETYLAAHFYALRDPQYQQEQNEMAMAIYQGKTGTGLELTWWGQQAKIFDVTGTLASLDASSKKGKTKISMTWLGSTDQRLDARNAT